MGTYLLVSHPAALVLVVVVVGILLLLLVLVLVVVVVGVLLLLLVLVVAVVGVLLSVVFSKMYSVCWLGADLYRRYGCYTGKGCKGVMG